jgi:hypothetical protein
MQEVRVTSETFAGLDDCLRLTNGVVELVVTSRVGPRIVSFSLADGDNVFFADEDTLADYDETEWNVFGGHRLWHAPEDHERTYVPDNDPIEYEKTETGVHLRQPVEDGTGIRKEISLELLPDEPEVIATHSLTNEGHWPVTLAPWGVTVLAGGGRCVVPFEFGPEAPEPNRAISLWPDASLADDRLSILDEYVLMDQDENADPTKLGVSATSGWAAYVLDGTAFCKSFDLDAHAAYPDRGSPVELYTDGNIFELESLAPLTELEPDETATYTERWHLFDGVDEPETAADVGNAPYPTGE